ncbi:MAG: DUF1294 domain-containing protein [Ruminococcaceae bacterium]|nr:DUF1294 domain-containing protein [Oscillospiraceae bacterium]
MDKLYSAALIYLGAISLVTFSVTALDKIFAKRNMRRVPEATLLTLALFGGAVSEYITMRLIRHKTLHKRFMVGLPVIIALQAAAAGAAAYFTFFR